MCTLKFLLNKLLSKHTYIHVYSIYSTNTINIQTVKLSFSNIPTVVSS